MKRSPAVVFDCNVFLQALANPDGPAGRCLQVAIDGGIQLFTSPAILEELRDVSSRPKVVKQLQLDADRTEEFLETVQIVSTVLEGFATPFQYERDVDDAEYVNLAIAAGIDLIVSRDRDLLDLMISASADAIAFRQLCPSLRIVDPVLFLKLLENRDNSAS